MLVWASLSISQLVKKTRSALFRIISARCVHILYFKYPSTSTSGTKGELEKRGKRRGKPRGRVVMWFNTHLWVAMLWSHHDHVHVLVLSQQSAHSQSRGRLLCLHRNMLWCGVLNIYVCKFESTRLHVYIACICAQCWCEACAHSLTTAISIVMRTRSALFRITSARCAHVLYFKYWKGRKLKECERKEGGGEVSQEGELLCDWIYTCELHYCGATMTTSTSSTPHNSLLTLSLGEALLSA